MAARSRAARPPLAEEPAAKVLANVMRDMESDVEARCAALKSAAAEAATALRQELRLQLIKLPRPVRAMPLAELKERFGGDVGAALLNGISGRLAAFDPPTSSLPGGVEATPARGCVPPRPSLLPLTSLNCNSSGPPGTVMRTTRKRKDVPTSGPSGAGGAPPTVAPALRVDAPIAFPCTVGFTPAPAHRPPLHPSATPRAAAPLPPPVLVAGTPLLQLSTVMAATRTRARAGAGRAGPVAAEAAPPVVAETVLSFTTEDGAQLDMSGPIPDHLKQGLRSQLEAVQAQVASFLTRLVGGGGGKKATGRAKRG